MSPQNRTPRQAPGDGLVPLLVRVQPEIRDLVVARAEVDGVSIATVVREALACYFRAEGAAC